MRLQELLFAATLAPAVVDAAVKFTTPAAGANVDPTAISVAWEDDSESPSIDELTSYTLQLMVGGNDDSDMTPVISIGAAQGQFSTGNKASGTVPATQEAAVKNGFFMKMIATAKEGGTIIFYSDRFNIPTMTGTTETQYVKAAAAVSGTSGPETVNQLANNAQANPAAGGAVAAAGAYTVPYALQSGLTKYAPMQSVPPTKITLQTFKPMYSTSKYSIATTWVAKPTILTTLTESQTFSVSSIENTAAAQAQPTGDMAKFLARVQGVARALHILARLVHTRYEKPVLFVRGLAVLPNHLLFDLFDSAMQDNNTQPRTFSSSGDYGLSRDFAASCRLNLQYYLWHDTLGFPEHLHPRIIDSLESTQHRRIADVGTGTGIFLTGMARGRGDNDELVGLDIDISQAPPKETLPSNVTFRAYDFFDDAPPEDLLGSFDVVHVRLVILCVRDGDPGEILRNLVKLLKPGGWLQWDEVDPNNHEVVWSRGKQPEDTAASDWFQGYVAAGGKHGWIERLGEYFETYGLVDMESKLYRDRPVMLRANSDQHMLTVAEFPGRLAEQGDVAAAEDLARRVGATQDDTISQESHPRTIILNFTIPLLERRGIEMRHMPGPWLLSVASVFFLLCLIATLKRPEPTLLWRQAALHPSRAYRAPMFACQYPDVINRSYGVFLHHGCSLDKHKHLIGEDADLDSRITHCFPETRVHGLYYYANDIDDVTLDAIRADVVVDLVECNRSPENLAESVDIEVFDLREL
ncbi:hypothetical protein PRZ48_009987 [Zasmidium cellare]|uniref:S-adenosyl-L-methionine-dependent methyltransferase n=1 Tax=Zasmidium cellare TaxID=395010 RepID=A0ABR0EDA6_ZASCE|nr:hypothetical protein PRZ48_009987 [Zasmidium cellare]